MKLGAENKRNVIALSVLAVIAAYAVWSNFLSGPSVPTSSASSEPAPAAMPKGAGQAAPSGPIRRTAAKITSEDWHPVLHGSRPEDQIDPSAVDPTLRLDRLAKLQNVPAAGSGRNLFSMSQAPPPDLPKGPEPKVELKATMQGPPPIPPEAPPPGPPPPPPLPPITFKYYGIATVRADGTQTAFFLDGENIIIKSVGETVEGTYKLVRIGANSAVVEDTKSKRQQTVPLAEEAQG